MLSVGVRWTHLRLKLTGWKVKYTHGTETLLPRWWNRTSPSCRTMYPVPCVEDVGSMGKGSHLKYHCRWSEDRCGTQLTDTYQGLLPGKQAAQFVWDVIKDSDIARLSPSKPCPELLGRIPTKATQLCSLLIPRCHLWLPALQHRFTSTDIQLKPFVFQPGEFSHGLTNGTSSLCSCTNTKTREEEGSPFQQQWAWAASSAFSGNCTLILCFSSLLLQIVRYHHFSLQQNDTHCLKSSMQSCH